MGIFSRLIALLKFGASPDNLVRKGTAMAKKENYLGAAEQFKKALELDPLYISAYDGLGKAFFRLGFREEAEREFTIADGLERLQEDRNDLDAGVRLGWALVGKSMYKQANMLLDPLLKESPYNPHLLKIIGLSHKGLGQDKKAREVFRVGLDRWPKDTDFYQHLGSLEIKSGNKAEGEKLINIARLMAKIDAEPHDASARYEMARVIYSRKKFNEAAEFMRQAVALEKDNADYWYFLGDCYHRAGLQPAAADAVKEATKLAPSDPKPHKLLAQIYQYMGKFEESKSVKQIASVLEGGQSTSKSPQQGAKFIKYLLSIGKGEDAKNSLNDLQAKWPDSIDLKLIEGRLMVKDALYGEAIGILKEVAQQKEDWAEPHIWMAVAYQKLGDNMSALAEGQLATRLAPKSHVIHKIFGDILREQKKFGMAENAYETAENLRLSHKGKS